MNKINKFNNDWYIEGFEDGYDVGYDDWHFVLVEVQDREITAESFDGIKEAREAMKKCYEEAGDAADEYFGEDEAWKTNANNHTNFNWRIIKFGGKRFMEGQAIK